MKQNNKQKQILESAQYGLEISIKVNASLSLKEAIFIVQLGNQLIDSQYLTIPRT